MVGTFLRRFVASWALVAVVAAGVAPAITHAWGGASSQSDAHACCPLTIGQAAPEHHSTGAPPCCLIGSTSTQVPASAPFPVRSGVSDMAVVPAPMWAQALAVTIDSRPAANVSPGPIPLLLRTSVLLI